MQEFKNMLKKQTPPQLDSITGPTPTPHIVQATRYTAQSRVKLIFMANIIDLFLVLCQTLFCHIHRRKAATRDRQILADCRRPDNRKFINLHCRLALK